MTIKPVVPAGYTAIIKNGLVVGLVPIESNMVRKQQPSFDDATIYVHADSIERDYAEEAVRRNRGTIPLPVPFNDFYLNLFPEAVQQLLILRHTGAEEPLLQNFLNVLSYGNSVECFVVAPGRKADRVYFVARPEEKGVPLSRHSPFRLTKDHPHYEQMLVWIDAVVEAEEKIEVACQTLQELFLFASSHHLTHDEFAWLWPSYKDMRACEPEKPTPSAIKSFKRRFQHKGISYIEPLLVSGALLPDTRDTYSWVMTA